MRPAPRPSPGIWVDDRYRGAHGIGRYAREVTSRLTVAWSSLGLDGAPARPLDFLRRLPMGARDGLIYSPGYGALLRAKRQVLTIHDLIHLQTDWPGRAKYLAYYDGVLRPAVRRNKVVLTVSEASRRAIEEWIGDDDVAVVNAGIGCSYAFTVEGDATLGDERYAVYAGNLRRHKNLDVVLRALGSVSDLRLVLVLPRSEHVDARARLRAWGIEDRVSLRADIDDLELARLYRGAVMTVFPSTQEGFGLPALESIMCGTPVIYWGGCEAVAETVSSNGRAVSAANDPEEWAHALRLELETATPVVPPSGRYDWDRTASLVSDVLRSLTT